MKTLLTLAIATTAILTVPQVAKAELLTANCTSQGQACNSVASMGIASDGPGAVYQLRLQAPGGHCSAVRYIVYGGDGRPLAQPTAFLNAGQSAVIPLGNNLVRGRHTVFIGAEGIVGGCNTGRLLSWGVDARAEAG